MHEGIRLQFCARKLIIKFGNCLDFCREAVPKWRLRRLDDTEEPGNPFPTRKKSQARVPSSCGWLVQYRFKRQRQSFFVWLFASLARSWEAHKLPHYLDVHTQKSSGAARQQIEHRHASSFSSLLPVIDCWQAAASVAQRRTTRSSPRNQL